jgi:diguanylate cyclase (GGDEF)-like protein
MLANHGDVSPELELLGETLQHLWKENRALAERAAHDPLTGLLTRQAFGEIALHLAHLARRQASTVGIMMLDLDFFKRINDTYGHQAGDRVLKAVSQIVQSKIRAADLASRYGGEEILIFMSDTQSKTANLVAERIRKSVDSAKPEGIEISLSIGLVIGIMTGDPQAELYRFINQADTCLYDAKRNGRNTVVAKQLA